jgi:hypothetical protein
MTKGQAVVAPRPCPPAAALKISITDKYIDDNQ